MQQQAMSMSVAGGSMSGAVQAASGSSRQSRQLTPYHNIAVVSFVLYSNIN